MSFEEPRFLFLFFFIIISFYIEFFYKRKKSLFAFPIFAWGDSGFKKGFKIYDLFHFFSIVLRYASFCSFVFAIANPYWIHKEEVYVGKGIDIMIVLDTSPSMSSITPSGKTRFDIAKENLVRFINKRRNDFIGLVSFGNEAVLYSPLTLDYEFLKEKLASTNLMELGDGTWIGGGISVALYHLQQSSSKKKVIILLTDGVSNFRELSSNSFISIAKKMGVSIYSLGIGSKEKSRFVVKDPISGKIYSGTSVGIFDDQLLKDISFETNGKYFSIDNIVTFEKTFDFIGAQEAVNNSFKVEIKKEYFFKKVVSLSLILIICSFFVKEFFLKAVL